MLGWAGQIMSHCSAILHCKTLLELYYQVDCHYMTLVSSGVGRISSLFSFKLSSWKKKYTETMKQNDMGSRSVRRPRDLNYWNVCSVPETRQADGRSILKFPFSLSWTGKATHGSYCYALRLRHRLEKNGFFCFHLRPSLRFAYFLISSYTKFRSALWRV